MKKIYSEDEYKEAVGIARLEGFSEGIENERNLWTSSLVPKTLEITIRVRGEDKEVEATRRVISFEDIKHGQLKILRYAAEEEVIKIVTKGKILQELLEIAPKDTTSLHR